MQQIAIIWAWAAWLMAAATILEWNSEGFQIHLFDKNPLPWRKVALSGWGRCNLTTGIDNKKLLLSKYTRGSDFIKKSLGKFSPEKCRAWFESHGLPLKTQDDNRVFPCSDDWWDVVEVFENIFAKYRDTIIPHYGEGVSVIARNHFCWTCFSKAIQKTNIDSLEWQEQWKFVITTSKRTYEVDFLVITTGGNAYANTGSSGDGYTFAKSLWHTITKLGPSLSSFLTKEKWMHGLSGLAFQNSRLNIHHTPLSWPILLTHFGISGPLAFSLSSHLAWDEIGGLRVYLSPIAKMDFSHWNTFLKEQSQLHPKKLITSILSEKLPRRFIEVLMKEYLPDLCETFVASISKDHREFIAKLLGEGMPITLLERRPWDEFVTAGWVDTDEIYPETMESRIQKNLYFAGEVINVDAVTGGFNFQACWAGGYAVGKDILTKLTQRG